MGLKKASTRGTGRAGHRSSRYATRAEAKAGARKARRAEENQCEGCGYPVAPSERWCGECLCEDDCAP